MLSDRIQRACPHGHVHHSAIADVADIRLRIDREGRFLPGVELTRRHVHESSLRRDIVRERIGKVAGVSFAPEPVLHQIHPFDQGIALKLCRQ